MCESSCNLQNVKLGECCEVLDHLRVPINSEERFHIQGDIPYYGANGLQGYINDYIFDEPLILLAEDGGYFDEYESRPIAYRIDGKSWVNNHAHVLRSVNNNKFYQDFIFFALEHKNITPFIKGGTRAKLNQSELREISIPNPSLNTQKKIAEILSTIDEAIEHTEALIEKTKKIKAGLMQDLFTRGVLPNGQLRPLPEEAPHLYKDSPLGWIPREWEASTIDSCLTSIDAGKSPDCPDIPASGDQWGVLKVGAINPEGFVQNENKVVLGTYLHNPNYLVKKGNILLSRANTTELVGLICYVDTEPVNLMLSDKTLRLNPLTEQISARFLFWALQLTSSRRQICNLATGTSGSMKNISQREVRTVEIPRPQTDEQAEISTRIDACQTHIRKTGLYRQKLIYLKKGLMHDLLICNNELRK